MTIRAVIIGCGKRGKLHAKGLSAVQGVKVVAFSDPVVELAEELADQYDGQAFEDTERMLGRVRPDFAAICTRPQVRLGPIQLCVSAGVRGIQCEKPMATSWNEARRIHALTEAAGVQLTFTHQRRFREDFAKARWLIADGALGAVEQMEGICSNFFDWGTHWFDMFFFLLGDIRAEWVMGQADLSEARSVFGAPLERRGVSYIQYEGGIKGILLTEPTDGAHTGVRVHGTEGLLEVFPHGPRGLRLLRAGGSGVWENPRLDLPGTARGHDEAVRASLAHSVQCLETGLPPLHGSEQGLKATELIYATFASAGRARRIDLPMDADPELDLTRIFA
jgi:predicted dehydrogenase